MIQVNFDNAQSVVVDYQTGARVERTVDLANMGPDYLPMTVDLGPDGRVVSVNLEAQNYEVRPVRVLMREG